MSTDSNQTQNSSPTNPTPDSRLRRRWLQFSLRSMLIFTMIVILFTVFIVVPADKQRRALKHIRANGGAWLLEEKTKDYTTVIENVAWYEHLWKRAKVISFDGGSDWSDPQVVRNNTNALSELSHLEYLHIIRGINQQGIQELSRLDNLKKLALYQADAADDWLPHIVKMKSLEELNIGQGEITDQGLLTLASVQRMKSLWLWETKITDQGMATIAKFPHLKNLHIGTTKITDVGLTQISKLTNLETLWINKTQITDKSIEVIRKCQKLKELSIDDSQITASGICKLSDLPNLESITLDTKQATEESLQALANMKPLKMIRVPHTKKIQIYEDFKKNNPEKTLSDQYAR